MIRVLIVDDDADIRDAVGDQLADLGCETVCASSGTSALSLLRAGERPDLILLDLVMPGMGGGEFLMALRRDPLLPQIPVVLMSASGAKALVSFEGVVPVVRKPMPPAQLDQIVRTHESSAARRNATS